MGHGVYREQRKPNYRLRCVRATFIMSGSERLSQCVRETRSRRTHERHRSIGLFSTPTLAAPTINALGTTRDLSISFSFHWEIRMNAIALLSFVKGKRHAFQNRSLGVYIYIYIYIYALKVATHSIFADASIEARTIKFTLFR